MEIDFEAIRRHVDEEMGPEWVQRYGDASWEAALALFGEPPEPLKSPAERRNHPPRSYPRKSAIVAARFCARDRDLA